MRKQQTFLVLFLGMFLTLLSLTGGCLCGGPGLNFPEETTLSIQDGGRKKDISILEELNKDPSDQRTKEEEIKDQVKETLAEKLDLNEKKEKWEQEHQLELKPEPEVMEVEKETQAELDKVSCNCQPGSTQECYQGIPGTAGKGVCKKGTQVCLGDCLRWGYCQNQVKPEPEICNGRDDNCDGLIDNGINSIHCYDGSPSTRNVGVCLSGMKSCIGGRWTGCQSQILPTPEICDGVDNDCDGLKDEGLSQIKCFYTGVPANSENIGICKAGSQRCLNGFWTKCTGEVRPEVEICDGVDNNCNGKIDDGLTRPKCTKQKGVCAGSLKFCGGKRGWIDCNHSDYKSHNSAYEIQETLCDTLDNNCDGLVDNNLPSTGKTCYQSGAKGVCANPGKFYCKTGNWRCSNPKPIIEVCNDKDDSCDGHVDDQACYYTFGQRDCVYLAKNSCGYLFDKNKKPIGKKICQGEGNGRAIFSFGRPSWKAKYFCVWWKNHRNCIWNRYRVKIYLPRTANWMSGVSCSSSSLITPPSETDVSKMILKRVKTKVKSLAPGEPNHYELTISEANCFRLVVCMELKYGG